MTDIHQFKNAKSLLDPIYIELSGADDRFYLSLQGVFGSTQYRPRLFSVPKLAAIDPTKKPPTNVVAMNSYDNKPGLTVAFPEQKVNVSLTYGVGSLISLELKRGDRFELSSAGGEYGES